MGIDKNQLHLSPTPFNGFFVMVGLERHMATPMIDFLMVKTPLVESNHRESNDEQFEWHDLYIPPEDEIFNRKRYGRNAQPAVLV